MPQCYSIVSIPPPFQAFHLHFENFFDALSTSYVKQKEAELLGLFIQGSSCQTILSANLMLLDIFKSIKPLILFFQISIGACSVSDANNYYELCLQRVKSLKKHQIIATQKTLIV